MRRPPTAPDRLAAGLLLVLATPWLGCGPDGQPESRPEDGPDRADDTARQEVVAERVAYATANGDTVRGYLAHPEGSPRGLPGVLVIHEWWGLNDDIRTKARRLAGEGYLALAVDLFGGEVAETPERARELTGGVDESAAESNLAQARAFLAERRGAPRIGSIGWCFGGGWSLRTALLLPGEVDAAVMYYGRVETDPERLEALRAPLLGIFGAEDQGIPVEDVRRFEAVLDSLGKEASVRIYEGADHAFANPSGDRYHAEAASDAWERTTAFLAEHLRP